MDSQNSVPSPKPDMVDMASDNEPIPESAMYYAQYPTPPLTTPSLTSGSSIASTPSRGSSPRGCRCDSDADDESGGGVLRYGASLPLNSDNDSSANGSDSPPPCPPAMSHPLPPSFSSPSPSPPPSPPPSSSSSSSSLSPSPSPSPSPSSSSSDSDSGSSYHPTESDTDSAEEIGWTGSRRGGRGGRGRGSRGGHRGRGDRGGRSGRGGHNGSVDADGGGRRQLPRLHRRPPMRPSAERNGQEEQ